MLDEFMALDSGKRDTMIKVQKMWSSQPLWNLDSWESLLSVKNLRESLDREIFERYSDLENLIRAWRMFFLVGCWKFGQEKEAEIEKLESDFKTFVDGLQKQYSEASEKKDKDSEVALLDSRSGIWEEFGK